ncbi:MAG: hypothetical protein NVSMB4_01410 [Acidimicrobiales bacterium]
MRTSRIAAAAAAASLSLFGVGAVSALADTAPTATTTAAPTVTLIGSTYTVAIPGVGDVSFALDAQGVASSITFSPVEGATTTPETEVSVTIPATTNAPARIVTISVEREDGASQVSVESEDEQGENEQGENEHSATPVTPTTPEVEKVERPEVEKPEAAKTEKPEVEKADTDTHGSTTPEHETND